MVRNAMLSIFLYFFLKIEPRSKLHLLKKPYLKQSKGNNTQKVKLPYKFLPKGIFISYFI